MGIWAHVVGQLAAGVGRDADNRITDVDRVGGVPIWGLSALVFHSWDRRRAVPSGIVGAASVDPGWPPL